MVQNHCERREHEMLDQINIINNVFSGKWYQHNFLLASLINKIDEIKSTGIGNHIILLKANIKGFYYIIKLCFNILRHKSKALIATP